MKANLKHVPRYLVEDGKIVYDKVEADDEAIFRKSKSLTINIDYATNTPFGRPCDKVRVNLQHRGVIVEASYEELHCYNETKSFYEEPKYHYPIERWTVVWGDRDWVKRL